MTERFGLIKNIYDSIKNSKNIDLNLFVNIVYKYNLHSDVLQNVDENVLSNNGENLKIFFEHKDIKISSIDDIVNIERTIFDRKFFNGFLLMISRINLSDLPIVP